MPRIGPGASLIHRGRVELEGLLEDVTFHVVFTLIYDVGLGVGDATTRRVTFFHNNNNNNNNTDNF